MAGKYLRHSWSHRGTLHRRVVRVFNAIAKVIPFDLKYNFGLWLRARRLPYAQVTNRSTVVQVGAPSDTLLAGRSRAMYFSLLTSPHGRVVVIEPDAASTNKLEAVLRRKGLMHVTVQNMGAWSHAERLRFLIDNAHPATNFTDGTVDYDESRRADFSSVEVDADSIDNILDDLGIERVDLVSITTNGAERQIIAGLSRTIAKCAPLIALARTDMGLVDVVKQYGYELMAYDDRGFTFKPSVAVRSS